MGLVLIVSLFTTRIVLKVLGVEDYGIYNVVSGFVSMFAFLNTSLSNGIQRFFNFSMGREIEYTPTDVYNSSLQIQSLLALALILLLETVGLWYMYNKMIIPPSRFSEAMWVFQFSVLSLIVIVFQIPFSASIMAHEEMDYFAYVSIFDVFAKLGIAFAIMYTHTDKLFLYGLLHLIVTIMGFSLYFFYAKSRFSELKFKFEFKKSLFKPMLAFSGWNVFGTFAYMIKGEGLNLLLNSFLGPVVNAARGVSSMIMSALSGFQSNIVVAFRPQLVQSYAASDYNRVNYLFFSLSKISFILLYLLAVPIILEIDFILKIWLGDTIPDYTIPFTILVLINMVISSLNAPVSQVVHATGKMKKYQIGTSLVICFILPVSWIALKFGCDATVVYWISLVFTIINQIVCNILLKSVYNYSYRIYLNKVIIPCLVYALLSPILPVVLFSIIDQCFIRLIIIIFTSILCSLFFAYYVAMDNSERLLVKQIISRK